VEGADVHVFYLQAPRALGDPELRHEAATIGHAVSRDLRRWIVLPDPLPPGPPGAFDDLAQWTGSVVRHAGRWRLFYTGISTRDDGRVQRIGSAASANLVRWERGDLELEADPRWYEKLDDASAPPGESWRDPWVFVDPRDRRFHMLVTARANTGPPDGRGVIGHAWCRDLGSWEIGPPLSEPGAFAQLEVPQLVCLGGVWRVLFSARAVDHSAARVAGPGLRPETGTHYLVGPDRLGPFALHSDRFLVGDAHGPLYAGRVVEHRGRWHFLAWRGEEDGGFAGELIDPLPLDVGADGALSVPAPAVPHASS
jgi:beta-fructofuranosidase